MLSLVAGHHRACPSATLDKSIRYSVLHMVACCEVRVNKDFDWGACHLCLMESVCLFAQVVSRSCAGDKSSSVLAYIASTIPAELLCLTDSPPARIGNHLQVHAQMTCPPESKSGCTVMLRSARA